MSDALVEAAKAPAIAYGEKDWDKVRESLAPDFWYDEVATHRKVEGVDQVLEVWKGWATAFPDSKPTFHNAHVSGNTVVLELSWKGTHTGPMVTADGEVPPTGKSMDMRAVQVIDVQDGKAAFTRQYFDMATLMSQLGLDG